MNGFCANTEDLVKESQRWSIKSTLEEVEKFKSFKGTDKKEVE